MMNLVSKLIDLFSTKVLWVLVIVLSTLLTVSTVANNVKSNNIDTLTELGIKSTEQNKRLSEQLKAAQDEITTRPVEYIETVREVEKEICRGKVTEAQINNIPSKRKEVGDANQAPTADIDDRLPPELVRVLQ